MKHKTPASMVPGGSTTTCTSLREAASFVVTIAGYLDFAAVEGSALAATLSSYRSDAALDVVLDLHAVTFLDSAGLGWLMSVRAAAELAGRKVRLRRSSASVDTVLSMTQLTRYFPTEMQQTPST